jgi:hypothetical protein
MAPLNNHDPLVRWHAQEYEGQPIRRLGPTGPWGDTKKRLAGLEDAIRTLRDSGTPLHKMTRPVVARQLRMSVRTLRVYETKRHLKDIARRVFQET